MQRPEQSRGVARLTVQLAALCAAALVLSPVSGCQSARKPSVVLDSATIATDDAPASGTRTLLVRLLASNPSDQPIPLREVRYELRAGNYRSGELSRDAERTVPRFGMQVVTLPVPVPEEIAQRVEAGEAWTVSGDVSYVPWAAWRRTLYESRVSMPRVAIEERRE